MFRRNLSSLHNLLLLAALVTVSVFPGGDGNARPCGCARRRACSRGRTEPDPVRVGDQFAVTIQIEGAANLGAFEFEFGADPSIASTTVADIHPGRISWEARARTTGELRLASSPTAPGAPLYAAYSYGAAARSVRRWPTSHDRHAGDGARHEQPGLGTAQSHQTCRVRKYLQAASVASVQVQGSTRPLYLPPEFDATRSGSYERSAKHAKQVELLRSPVGVVDVGENQAGGLCQGGQLGFARRDGNTADRCRRAANPARHPLTRPAPRSGRWPSHGTTLRSNRASLMNCQTDTTITPSASRQKRAIRPADRCRDCQPGRWCRRAKTATA